MKPLKSNLTAKLHQEICLKKDVKLSNILGLNDFQIALFIAYSLKPN